MIRFIVGMLVGILLLVLFASTADIHEMLVALKSANYAYVMMGITAYLVSLWFRTIRWRILLMNTKQIKTRRLFPVVIIGYMVNNVLPFRIGELVRSYYLSRRESVSTATGLSTILIERVMDSLALLLLIGATSFFVPLSTPLTKFSLSTNIDSTVLIILFTLPFIITFICLVLVALNRKVAIRLMDYVAQFLPKSFKASFIQVTEKLLDGLKALTDKRQITKSLLISIPIWLAESTLFYFIAFSLNIDEGFYGLVALFTASILVTGITNIVSSIPAAPGGLGIFELVARETLVYMPHGTIGRPEAAAFAAITHACLLLPPIIMGQVFLWFSGTSLISLSKNSGTLNRKME